MTDVSNCFVLAFSRTEQGIRIEAVIKALSRRHARSAAFQMAAMNLGAIALSETGHPGLDEWGDAEILAQFGDVPDGLDLHYQIKALWNSGVLQDTSANNQPLAKATPSANSLLSRLSNIMPFVTTRERRGLEGPKRWLANTCLVVVGLAASGSGAMIIEEQRESRLMEMARPACIHAGTTNKELRRLVESEFAFGTSKEYALHAVVALCQVSSRLL